MKTETAKQTTWRLYECKRGNRWSECNHYQGWFADTKHGDKCEFSGCNGNHTVKLINPSANADEAAKWYRNVTR